MNEEKVCLTITLPLAERLIKKFVDENKIEAEAEIQLYLLVLEKQVQRYFFFYFFETELF